MADAAFLRAQLDTDTSENAKVLFEEKSPGKERAGVRNSQVVEIGGVPQVGEGLVTDRSPVAADPEVKQKSENSEGVEKLKDDGKAEEQEIIEVQEDWDVSVVEDLGVPTKSVGEAAGKIEEPEISREEFLSDDKDDENATSAVVVEKKDNEKATDDVIVEDNEEEKTASVVVVGSEDDKEHERATNLIVPVSSVSEEKKSIEIVDSMSTPPSQVKTMEESVDEDDYDLVTREFLNFLGGESSPAVGNSDSEKEEPYSPRAQLLQEFEQEALIEGSSELNFHLPEYAKFRVEGAQEKDDGSSRPADKQPASQSAPDNTDGNLGELQSTQTLQKSFLQNRIFVSYIANNLLMQGMTSTRRLE